MKQNMVREVKSNCHYCGYLCGFIATVEEVEPCEAYPGGERLVNLKPDPSRYPYDERIINGCRRWKMNLTELDGAGRVNYPLKRVGERGSGEWKRITWDEALDEIAETLRALAAEHGTWTLATAIGGPHATYWPLHRFMNLWGSPNNMGIGQICWNIRIWMDALAYGWPIEVSIIPEVTEQIFLWGTNPAESDNSLFWRSLVRMRKEQNIPLVVIDPRTTKTARLATLHLAPRVGTDCTLALALIREIIARERHDQDFVTRWCHGFEELVAHVQPYTLAHAEAVCGVPAVDIAAAAELFSNSGPTALLSGRGVDQLGPATAPTHRALSLLRAITGDVDRPGACYIMDMSDFIPEIDLEMSAALSDEAKAAQLNRGFTALQSYPGYEGATQLTSRLGQTPYNPEGKRLPMRYLASAHPHLVWRSMLQASPERRLAFPGGLDSQSLRRCSHRLASQLACANCSARSVTPPLPTKSLAPLSVLCGGPKEVSSCQAESVCQGNSLAQGKPMLEKEQTFIPPYRVSALICMGANPLITYADTQLVQRALESLELLVVLEFYLTPTAQLADYVLPIAGAFERPQFQAHGGVSNFAYGGLAAVAPSYERRDDYDFFRELGMRLGQEDYWPSKTMTEALEKTLHDAGTSLDSWRERGIYAGYQNWRKHEQPDEKGRPQGFATTTGTIELVNEYLQTLGSTALPVPAQPAPTSEDYPITLITGARKQPYWASSYFNNLHFRSNYPYPQADMSSSTMEALRLKEGDWVVVATEQGEARFVATEAALIDDVVSVDYGWWFPEEDGRAPELFGALRSNANMLTTASIETCEPLIGSWTYNGIPCRVEKLNSDRA